MAMNFDMPITVLKGIGPKKAAAYHQLNIFSIMDLVNFFPRTYEVSKGFTPILEVVVGETHMIQGVVKSNPVSKRVGRMTITTVLVGDATGDIYCTWFNQTYLQKQLKIGREMILKGKVGLKYGRAQLLSPKIIGEKDMAYLEDKSVLPVYPLTLGLNQKQIRLQIAEAMAMLDASFVDYMPEEIRDRYQLLSLKEAFNQIHYPDGEKATVEARRRLVFDEFLLFQLGLMMIKEDQTKLPNAHVIGEMRVYNLLLSMIPYSLTGAQERVLGEIQEDMKGPYAMNRLVQGDVGSGKTIVAALALALQLGIGRQGVMMAPTEVLANQHYEGLKALIEPLGYKVERLVGSMSVKEKQGVKERLANGQTHLIVGTHALIEDNVAFDDLGLVITDEQHRFGVKQRERLAIKGYAPHVLVMSATPIPRTLALIVYGDMDVSIIDELPPGRQTIETYSVGSNYRDRLMAFMAKEVGHGHQCYVVCPKVEASDEEEEATVAQEDGPPLMDVVTYQEMIGSHLPVHIKSAYLHGKMKASMKQDIMTSFIQGDIHILVSTTVIEVGVNVPNATVMIIENAERFGLAQLHQLRGRVGRGESQSYCILVTDSRSEQCKKRMAIMTESDDGFVIAQKDLELRGHGDLLGTKQSGLPNFRIGNILDDVEILKLSNDFAKELMADPKMLAQDDYILLKEKIENYMKAYMTFIAL